MREFEKKLSNLVTWLTLQVYFFTLHEAGTIYVTHAHSRLVIRSQVWVTVCSKYCFVWILSFPLFDILCCLKYYDFVNNNTNDQNDNTIARGGTPQTGPADSRVER